MTLNQAIARLAEIRDYVPEDQDPDIRIAYQESYPLAGSLRGMVLNSDAVDPEEEFIPLLPSLADEPDPEPEPENPELVWLVMGSGHWDFNPYEVPRNVFDAAY